MDCNARLVALLISAGWALHCRRAVQLIIEQCFVREARSALQICLLETRYIHVVHTSEADKTSMATCAVPLVPLI